MMMMIIIIIIIIIIMYIYVRKIRNKTHQPGNCVYKLVIYFMKDYY